MKLRTWLNTLATCTAITLPACGDDAPTNVETGDSGSSGDSTGTTGTVMTTAVDTTAGAESSSSGGSGSETGVEDVCGDGTVAETEPCDDGNLDDADGCSALCEIETGFVCDGEPSACTAICGDGLVLGDEQCDDANEDPDDGCDAACVVEPGWSCGEEPSVCETGCGDGIVVGMEQCDDANPDGGDGCSARCTVEPGWLCMDEPSACAEECGDGLVVGAEQCDDGDFLLDDGCDDLCAVEPGWYCEGEPSACDTRCGDGLIAGTELCDDGNLAQGDGCNPACSVDFPYSCDMAEPSNCTVTEVFAAVALGGEGGCILTAAGEAACFGNDSEGEVGNGTVDVETFLPVPVLDQVVAITAGDEHHCAIRNLGEVWCWGDNANRQMGPASAPPADETTPVQVTGLPVIDLVDAGYDHNCAIDNLGAVWCWGDNDNRQLGRGGAGTTDDANPAPVALPGDLGAIDLGMGENHSCAVLADNTVACWGDDDSGQLGDGASGTDSGSATLVPGLVGIVEVEAGRDATCARDDLGGVWCWGNNEDGEVGNGANTDVPTPQPVALPAPAVAISMGTDFSCAMSDDDQVFCWGEGSDYQLGYGNLINQNTPVAVIGLPVGDLVGLEAGARGVCVTLATNERWCWGYSEEGQLGLAPLNQLDLAAPLAFSGPVASVELAASEYRGATCGVLVDGTVECSGDATVNVASTATGASGYFSPGITHHLRDMTAIPGLTGVEEIGLGSGFACVRTAIQVLCWGDNANRNLGQGGTTTTDSDTPLPVMGLGSVDELDVGNQFACMRTVGTVACWGDNDSLQTGDDSGTTDQSLPFVVPVINDALDVECGENHACALRAGGVVSCWGDDGVGQLGDNDGNPADTGVPVDVTGLPGPADQIVVGQDHACALVANEVYCWGAANHGQLGQGDTLDSDTALLVPGLGTVVQIASGYNFVCARDDMDTLTCWGYGLDGQLGNGGGDLLGPTDYPTPAPFQMATGITDVVMGNSHTCVETAAGWQCLGFRSAGQIGDGTTVEPALPTPMLFGL